MLWEPRVPCQVTGGEAQHVSGLALKANGVEDMLAALGNLNGQRGEASTKDHTRPLRPQKLRWGSKVLPPPLGNQALWRSF
jgi:hypothetical protein